MNNGTDDTRHGFAPCAQAENGSADVSTAHGCSRPDSSNAENTVYEKPLLVVGAGGIGCELLKVLVLTGFRSIHVLDLDTVDATNLNRQFLFTAENVGQPKSVTARAEVMRWFAANSACPARTARIAAAAPRMVALHDNITAPKFDEDFFAQFAVVLSALDNVAARQHVNRMCARAGVGLIESGTMGYNGQVQPIVHGRYECYDCWPKPAQRRSFAVCTIHARPTAMVHCVHFAKELYETLFVSAAAEVRGGTAVIRHARWSSSTPQTTRSRQR